MQRRTRGFCSSLCSQPSAWAWPTHSPPFNPPSTSRRFRPAAQPSDHFDPDAATEAYMAMIPPAVSKPRSDAYFEGGYWLILWDFLYASAMMSPAPQPSLVRKKCATSPRRITPLPLAANPALLGAVPGPHPPLLGFPLEFYEAYVCEA